MNELEKVIKEMDFRYFGMGQHNLDAETFLASDNTVLLDIRAREEVETVKFPLSHFCEVLEIPTNEVPDRIDEIPKDKTVGVFCSAGVRAVIIFVYLRSKGYNNVRIIPGGYAGLMEAVKPGKLFKKLNR
ncbi:rhodanese-like domain-containing protein [Thermophagus sp. OGC60D27]|uniref:rhodanese-like domain-containing protein n=1 Tax=Thermophagus sp. OGC60D27 TaxID=3458415 RepID=UPI004037D832